MIKERITQFLNKEGLTPSQFAEVIGIQRSSMSHILSGRNKPSYDFFERLIKNYPNINLEWFFNGSGSIYKDGEYHQELSLPETKSVKEVQENNLQKETKTKETITVTNVNKVVKVLLLFTDGTFEYFHGKD